MNSVKTQPTFATGLTNTASATMYIIKAQQAYSAGQWQQVCVFAQAAYAAARNERITKITAQNLLAAALLKLGQIEQAIHLWLDLNVNTPNNGQVLSNLGFALSELERYDEAIQYLQQSILVMPEHAIAHLNLGIALSKTGHTDQAKLSYAQALKLNPNYAKAKFCLGNVLQEEGLIEEAITAYEQGLQLEPNNVELLSNLTFLQHALYPFDMKQHMKTVRQFGAMVEKQAIISTPNKKLQQHTPLRIGIVSGDLCRHVVCRFLESTLEQIISNAELRPKVTLVAYSNLSKEDEITQKIKTKFDLWRQINKLSDAGLAEQISKDDIDILIDLSGHTKGNRLPVFAKKAAPLQVSWLGYWGSTGLSSIDYVIADPISVPNTEEHFFLEKVWRLPHLRYCVSIPDDATDVTPPPCITNQAIVFGCYQFIRKINSGVLDCWAKILTACPLARIRIQSFSLDKTELKEQFIIRLKEAGLDLNRIDLIGGMGTAEYMASYAEVDILLDTFPYPGGTTTAQALWMGVPTITLATVGMLGRQGEALLANAGLSAWIANSEEEYVQKAIAWGNADSNKRQDLAVLRANLRTNMAETPVFNAKEFAVDFVDAMYGMWHEKCNAQNKS